MNRVPFRQQPSFRALIFAVLLAAIWVYDLVRGGGWAASVTGLGLDLMLLGLLLALSVFFYSQFVLPVRTLHDRLRICSRTLLHAVRRHGPVVFIQNGRKVDRHRQAGGRGPGLLWIDTASAAMTRSEAGPKRALGPGIHFLHSKEQLESTFSLHAQTCSIGPGQDEPVFERLPEDAGEAARRRHADLQSRRQAVSGLTRDGNEVIPEIRVVFKLEGHAAPPGGPGSHFGFMRQSIERAARGQGVNVDPVSARRSYVAWNQLPGLIAVDLWREYLAKFTLDELFNARFGPAPHVLQPEEPVPADAFAPQPIGPPPGFPARMLLAVGDAIEKRLSSGPHAMDSAWAQSQLRRHYGEVKQVAGRQYTALQIIAHMVKARMTQGAVPSMDEYGRYGKGQVPSEEFKRLRERGLRVLDVTLGGYRFDPAVEAQIVQQWKTAWLESASSERGHVEQLEVLAAEAGRQQALLEHAQILARALRAASLPSIPAALAILLKTSHDEILMDERLHGQGAEELGSLATLAKWVESPSNE
ncbi:MAG TPA: hypothetical protein VLL49_10525 [Anaerolineales bacterium]|nr:hypothetical protein [Anaerolineales bacterium]